MELQYKKCTLNELELLREISEETFVHAFESHNNPEDFKAYIDKAFALESIQKQLLNPATHFYFVLKEAQVIGYFKLNEKEAQSDLYLENTIELERIYIVKEAQGNGYGTHVLNEVLRLARLKKMKSIWLGVWEHNTNAIRLYERFGFVKFGSHPYWLGNDKQTDFVLKFEL